MTHPAPAVTYTVPKVDGDVAAARQIATAYRELAQAVADSRRRAELIVQALTDHWRGAGEQATRQPLSIASQHAILLTRALDEAADELDRYAGQLEQAHHRHWYSLGNLVKLGAVVTVSAAAIVVTVGAAGVAEAAATTAAVESAADAAGSAAAASTSAAVAMLDALRVLTSMRPLLSFTLDRLLQAEWSAAGTAAYDQITEGRLDWKTVGTNAGAAFGGAIVANEVTLGVRSTSWYVGTSRNLQRLATATAQGTVWTGLDGVDQLSRRELDVTDLVETFVIAGGGTTAHEGLKARGWWPSEPDYRRDALVGLLRRPGMIRNPLIAAELASLRQPLLDLERGDVDLLLNEGPGHTIARHVGRNAESLGRRLHDTRLRYASSFFDEATARHAIAATLRANAVSVERWARSEATGTFSAALHLAQPVGYTVDRAGVLRLARGVRVVLSRDAYGVVVRTSYPELTPRR